MKCYDFIRWAKLSGRVRRYGGSQFPIFGSGGEKRGSVSIERTWGDSYRVFPQFPFSALFEPDESIRDTSNFFFKTSVDYVLYTNGGEPTLPHFDGTYASLEARIAADGRVERVGSECTLFETPVGDISATAWMRDIGKYSPGVNITRELAELLAWLKLTRLLSSSSAAMCQLDSRQLC